MRSRNTKERYVEILSFQHFKRFMTFTSDGEDYRNKVLKNKIDVSVVLDMECVDISILPIVNEIDTGNDRMIMRTSK